MLSAKLIKTKGAAMDCNIDFTMQELQEMDVDQPGVASYLEQQLAFQSVKQPSLHSINKIIQTIATEEENIDTFQSIMRNKIPEESKTLKVSKTAEKVDILKAFMIKYAKTSSEEILAAILKEGDKAELDQWRTLTLVNNFTYILKQAQSEFEIERDISEKTYVDKFIEECPVIEGEMSIIDTLNLYTDWWKFQGINYADLLLKMYCVLNKEYPKVNSLMLQGASNAGKTYWTSALLPFPDVVGQSIQSTDFIYMKCIDKQVIQIPELTLTKIEQVEEFKKVMEGLPTTVNIKNKEPRLLKRTPVLLTCNDVPWTFFSGERETLLNRMFSFENLKPAPMLKDKRAASSRFFARVFKFIKFVLAKEPEFPGMPNDQLWDLLLDQIDDYCAGLKMEYDLSIDQLLDNTYMATPNEVPRTNRLNWKPQDRIKERPQELYMALLRYLSVLRRKDSEDYYFNFANSTPILMSSFTGEEYQIENDLDLADLNSFRSGYVHLRRILMKLKTWPTEFDGQICHVTQDLKLRYKAFIKKTLNYMTEILANVIQTGKEMRQIISQEFKLAEAQFRHGINRGSTPKRAR